MTKGKVILGFLIQAVMAMTMLHDVAGQCVDLVQDCGGKADNHTDNAPAFAVCQHLASQRSGCITVPAGLFRMNAAFLNTSNIEIRVDIGAVFLPVIGLKHSTPALFVVGNKYNIVSSDYVQNVSMYGEAPGKFTMDVSIAQYDPWQMHGVAYVGGIKGFVLANMLCKMANPVVNPKARFPSSTACINSNYESFNGERLNPQNGVLHNLTGTGGTNGYGLIQIRSGENMSLRNLYSEGGVTLHLETGDGPGGYVGDIVAQNLTCKDGSGVVMSIPHQQMNGAYHLQDLLSLGCNVAINFAGGYPADGNPPGHFSNSSTVTNIVGVYGTHAQNSSAGLPVPACAPCTNQNSPLNYKVTVSGIKAIGFPAPSNRTECIYYRRSKGCPFSR